MPLVHDLPSVDEAPADGVPLHPAGPDGLNGEFDSPVDPRFPTYVASNLSEALPGPFSAASASATVRGLRAGGASIAERLRLPGVIGREIATRSVGTFAHRVYGGVTSVYYMATSMPGTNPDSMTDHFFGRELGDTPVFGAERLRQEKPNIRRRLQDLLLVGLTGVGLVAGCDIRVTVYTSAISIVSRVSCPPTWPHSRTIGWRASSCWPAIWLCTDGSCRPGVRCSARRPPRPRHAWAAVSCRPRVRSVASGRALASLRRLADMARADPQAVEALSAEHDVLATIQERAPELYRAIREELSKVGHRGPAECELRSTSYADDPEQFARMIAKSLTHQRETLDGRQLVSIVPSRGRLAQRIAARQLRDREVRRDKVVRANAILRQLLREHGRRLVGRDILDQVDDVFFFQVDELEALPADVRALVARRRAEMARLAEVRPASAFSDSWTAVPDVSELRPGQVLKGLGVSGGRIKGRVRIVDQHTIDDLQPGEVLVAEVTDVGYTPAFAYAGAVVTNLGGPMSHAAIVAREFGVTCVVDARNATRRLPAGALVEVSGSTGEIRVLEAALESPAGAAPSSL